MNRIKVIDMQNCPLTKAIKLLALILLVLMIAWSQQTASADSRRAIIILYEGNNCTQDIVGVIRVNSKNKINFKRTGSFVNDEARSFMIHETGAGHAYFWFYDDPNSNRSNPFHDDYLKVEIKGRIERQCIRSFEPSPRKGGQSTKTIVFSNGAEIKLEYYYDNNLDGKVSSVIWGYYRSIAVKQTCGGDIRYGQRLSHFNYVDWPHCDYWFEGKEGDIAKVSLEVTSGNLKPKIILFNRERVLGEHSNTDGKYGLIELSRKLKGPGPYGFRITSAVNPRTYGSFEVYLTKYTE